MFAVINTYLIEQDDGVLQTVTPFVKLFVFQGPSRGASALRVRPRSVRKDILLVIQKRCKSSSGFEAKVTLPLQTVTRRGPFVNCSHLIFAFLLIKEKVQDVFTQAGGNRLFVTSHGAKTPLSGGGQHPARLVVAPFRNNSLP